MPPNSCTLCHSVGIAAFATVRERHYWHCPVCDLVFLDPAERPSRAEEEAEYRLHDNDVRQSGYRRHLARLGEPLFRDVPVTARCLDFGCGPMSSLSLLAREWGYDVDDYDPFFAPDLSAGPFDIVAMSEVAEHLFEPAEVFTLLAGKLAPGGRLGVMTELRAPETVFADWYYLREISHVTFYSAHTWQWLAERFAWRLARPDRRVAIFYNEA